MTLIYIISGLFFLIFILAAALEAELNKLDE